MKFSLLISSLILLLAFTSQTLASERLLRKHHSKTKASTPFTPVCVDKGKSKAFLVYVEKSSSKSCDDVLISLKMDYSCTGDVNLEDKDIKWSYLDVTDGKSERKEITPPKLKDVKAKAPLLATNLDAITKASGCKKRRHHKLRLALTTRVKRTRGSGAVKDFDDAYKDKVLNGKYKKLEDLQIKKEDGTDENVSELKGAVAFLSRNDPGWLLAKWHQHLTICAINSEGEGFYFFFEKGYDSPPIGVQFIGKSMRGCSDEQLLGKALTASAHKKSLGGKILDVAVYISGKALKVGAGIMSGGLTVLAEKAYDAGDAIVKLAKKGYELFKDLKAFDDIKDKWKKLGKEDYLPVAAGTIQSDKQSMQDIFKLMVAYADKFGKSSNDGSENSQHFAVGFYNYLTGEKQETKDSNWSKNWQDGNVVTVSKTDLTTDSWKPKD